MRTPLSTATLVLLVMVLAPAGCIRSAKTPEGAAASSYDPQPYADVLAAAVRGDAVDYAAVRAHEAELMRYLAMVDKAGPRSQPELFPTRNDRTAFYLNAYNATVLRKWLDYGAGTDKPRRDTVDSIWFAIDLWPLDGWPTSLRDMERDHLIDNQGDARAAFALARGRRSDPPLRAEPYAGSKLDEQLNDQVRRFLASDDWRLVDGTLQLPEGFAPWEKSLQSLGGWAGVFERYLPENHPRRRDAIRAAVAGRISYRDADGRINAAPPAGS